jgi:hypothetical protein
MLWNNTDACESKIQHHKKKKITNKYRHHQHVTHHSQPTPSTPSMILYQFVMTTILCSFLLHKLTPHCAFRVDNLAKIATHWKGGVWQTTTAKVMATALFSIIISFVDAAVVSITVDLTVLTMAMLVIAPLLVLFLGLSCKLSVQLAFIAEPLLNDWYCDCVNLSDLTYWQTRSQIG